MKRVTSVLLALVLASCGSRAAKTKPAEAAQVLPPLAPTEAYAAYEIDRPFSLAPGETDIASAPSKDFCALLSPKQLMSTWGLTTKPSLVSGFRTDDSMSCSAYFQDEHPAADSGMYFVWRIQRIDRTNWPTKENSFVERTLRDTTVADKPSLLTLEQDNAEIYTLFDSTHTLVTQASGAKELFSEEKLAAMSEQLHAAMKTFSPGPEPARDKPTKLGDLTISQLCDLLDDDIALPLLRNSGPSGINTAANYGDSANCSIASAKLGIEITTKPVVDLFEENISPVTFGDHKGTWDKASNNSEEPQGLYTVTLRTTFKNLHVQVAARMVPNTKQTEAYLLAQMERALTKLERRLLPG